MEFKNFLKFDIIKWDRYEREFVVSIDGIRYQYEFLHKDHEFVIRKIKRVWEKSRSLEKTLNVLHQYAERIIKNTHSASKYLECPNCGYQMAKSQYPLSILQKKIIKQQSMGNQNLLTQYLDKQILCPNCEEEYLE